MRKLKLLLIDDEADFLELLRLILTRKGYDVTTASSGADGLRHLQSARDFDAVLTDLLMDGMTGLEVLNQVKSDFPQTEVIILTAYGSIETAVEAMKQGAFSYYIKSNDPEEILMSLEKIKKILFLESKNAALHEAQSTGSAMLESRSPAFRQALDHALKAAATDVNVLLLGESGVGKEVFARFIHENSARCQEIFLPVNSYAFSDSMLESELYGHEKGAFTGSTSQRTGRFEAADKGTLFLDEIGELPLSTQIKMLRTIETREISRIGSNTLIPTDFRLLSATNRSLLEGIREKTFREDLYYRISTIIIEIPPLRERSEDIPLLFDYFLEKAQREIKKTITRVDEGLKEKLFRYTFPGNVRELKNTVERLVVLSEDGVLKDHGLFEKAASAGMVLNRPSVDQSLRQVRQTAERQHIIAVIEHCSGDLPNVAEILEISLRQLYNKLNEYGIQK
ncbi:sigma-54-dependent transcriptional regulator [Acidaminobacter hydrogenoformans]|uniref:Stage 0 sporulation protein A homolog n=1 Tax=Acidaminobacter hydrogenoformans DSM 2784 TaxID=1120920 RepID=A0A1G5RUV9_9FIRM|nr:sigma-54 dependent transcriptional regulator [Acidaminobacter hydrogenoformans]SCZ77935.1 DNA-binding transcriptional response regulator, NtrC family, contains REC, AAA-type ATPase, and a Fis-type DNA-binding domains [Acidaminobacter hydrogenoformans DSM 2784]